MEPPSCLEAVDLGGSPSALHCRDRWLALQHLRASAGAEAVLLILGPDSNFDRAGEVLFNWLLGGFSGRDLLAAPLDSRYEECVVCIGASASKVFCKRRLREELVVKTAMWESCEVIAPSPEQEADQDAYETCKTWAFIDMVSGLKSVGVVLRESDGAGQLKMLVERWPLVQAHAYDEFGLGFLTLKASVVNLEAALQRELYPQWDLLSVLRARALLPKLVKAWDEAILLRDRQPRKLGEDVVTAAAAPLVDFFEYGRLSLSDEDVMEMRGEVLPPNVPVGALLLNPAPRVLVGTEQSCGIRVGVAFDMLSTEGTAIADVASHMVWEAVEPLTGAAASRSYALGGGALLERGGVGGDAPAEHRQALLRAYAVAVAVHRHLVAGPLARLAFLAPEQRDAALHREALELEHTLGGTPGRLEVFCAVMDAMGLVVPAGAVGSSVTMLFLRVIVADVAYPGLIGTLGTVAFGDSVFCVRPCTGDDSFCSCSTGLASDVPAFALWPSVGDEARSLEVRAGMDSCLGIGYDPGPSVALGHRSGVRVYLEKKAPPPDPLALGSCIEREVPCTLAWDISTLVPGEGPIAGSTTGHVWTFESGKLVISTYRTGQILLQVVFDGPRHLLSAIAPNGQVWVPVEPVGFPQHFRIAVAVNPSTASVWKSKASEEARQRSAAVEGLAAPEAELNRMMGTDLAWTAALRRPEGGGVVAALPPQLLALAALAGAHRGGMAAEACQAALSEPRFAAAPPLAPCRCIWVSGLPGCGVLDVAVGLTAALRAQLVDLAAVLGLGVGATDGVADMRFVASVLAGLVQTLVAQGASSVVVCDVLCSPADVLSDLAVQGSLAAVCHVTHVVSVLDPVVAYPSRGVRHPLLLSRCLRGWVSAVVIQDARPPTSSRGSRSSARGREALASLLAKEATAARGSGEGVLHRNIAALASGPLQLPPAGSALRALALPDAPGCRALVAPSVSLRCTFVAVALPLNVAGLREACLASLDAATASPEIAGAFRGLFCIEVRVRGLVASDLEELRPEELVEELHGEQALHQLVLSAGGEAPVPEHWPEPLASRCGLLFWWCLSSGPQGPEAAAARRAAAEAAVEDSRLRPPALRVPWELKDIPEDMLQEARLYMLSVEVPQGYFFNGISYMDVDGREQRDHPLLGQRLQLLLSEHNAGVQAWNAAVREATAFPLFTAPSARG